MKNISELTNEDSEILASILKYDIPYAEGVKEEIIECYNQDIEGLMLGKYLPIKLFFTGLNWLCNQGYDLSELIKNLGIDNAISTPPQLREGELEDGKKQEYPCRFCDKTFTDEYDLAAHLNFNHNRI